MKMEESNAGLLTEEVLKFDFDRGVCSVLKRKFQSYYIIKAEFKKAESLIDEEWVWEWGSDFGKVGEECTVT